MIVMVCYSFFSLCVVCLLSGKNKHNLLRRKRRGGNPYLEWMCGKSMQATVKCSGIHALKRVTRLNKSPRSVCVCVTVCVRMFFIILSPSHLNAAFFYTDFKLDVDTGLRLFLIKFAATWMFQLFYPSAIFFFPPVPQLQTHGCQEKKKQRVNQ